jgi:hypothetical protein
MKNLKNDMKVMKFKKFISYLNLRESLKEIELNSILDKIAKRMKLSSGEETFLDTYDNVKEDELKSFAMLSRQSATEKIDTLIESGKKVICNLEDRSGKIGLEIISTENLTDEETTILKLKHSETYKMKDNFLYNLIFDIKKNIYSLEASDEFFEKIPVKND